MREVKVSIRIDGDELPLIAAIKEVAKKHKVNVEKNFIHKTKNVKEANREGGDRR